METKVYDARVNAIDTEENRKIVGSRLLDEFKCNASQNVYADAIDYIAEMPLIRLLSISVDNIEQKLRRKYVEKIFASYIKHGEMNYVDYDRTKGDKVNNLTGLSIQYTDDMSLNQLEIISRHPHDFLEDFEIFLEDEYPEVLKDTGNKYRNVTVHIEIVGENINHYMTLVYRRFGKRKHIPWKGVIVKTVSMAFCDDGKTTGTIILKVDSKYNDEEITDGIYDRLGLTAKKHPWYECQIVKIEM